MTRLDCSYLAYAFIAVHVVIDLPTLALAQTSYASLASEIKQWHSSNPGVCGQDTQTCAVQRLIDQFEPCAAFRIVNGCPVLSQATVGWQVGILLGKALCSGTLMSPRHVVLAAHCVRTIGQSNTGSITVAVGAINLREVSTTQLYAVQAFAMHPNFDSNAISSDAAIIKLARDVQFASSDGVSGGIRPACLATQSTQRSLRNCVVSGYGVNDTRDPFNSGSGRLRYTVLNVVSDTTCAQTYGVGGYNSKLSFCGIGQRGVRGTDTCNGDSGSGFLCKDSSGRWTLQGIVSFGVTECASAPGVYADAYALGLQSPTQRGFKSDRCGSGTPQSSFSTPPPSGGGFGDFSPSSPGGSGGGAFGGGGQSQKKAGGLGSTIVDTLRKSGCSQNSECVSNTCKSVGLCRRSRTKTNDDISEFRDLMEDFLPMSRPVKTAKQVVNSFAPKSECSQSKICWPEIWKDVYTSVPQFEFS